MVIICIRKHVSLQSDVVIVLIVGAAKLLRFLRENALGTIYLGF